MDPVTLAGIISAGSGIVTSLINRGANKSLSNNAYRQNVEMWERQNAYNSPVAQVGRLRAAGLNPALAYGGNGQLVGNSESAPQLDYSGVYSQPVISPDAVMQGFESASQVVNMNLAKSQTELNDAKTITELREGVKRGIDLKYADDTAKEMLNQIRLKNDNIYQDTQRLSETIDNLIATRNLTKEQIYQLELVNEFNDRTMESRIEATQLMPAETRKRMQEIDSVMAKNYAEVGLIKENLRTAVIQNGMLPALLRNDLSKGFHEVQNLIETNGKIKAEIRSLSVKTGIDEKELENWFWFNAPNVSKLPGAMAGAFTDNAPSWLR